MTYQKALETVCLSYELVLDLLPILYDIYPKYLGDNVAIPPVL